MLKWPKWRQDLEAYHNIKNTFIIQGNVHDLQPWISDDGQRCSAKRLTVYLYDFLKEKGYEIVSAYNKVDGFFSFCQDETIDKITDTPEGINNLPPLEQAAELMRIAIANSQKSVAIIFDLANTAISSSSMPSECELNAMTRLLLASKASGQAVSTTNGKLLTNSLFFIVEKTNDLPTWFFINNPNIKTISITKVDRELRKTFIRNYRYLWINIDADTSEKERLLDELASLTDGFSMIDLLSFLNFCDEKAVSVLNPKSAVDFYKFGVAESYWDNLSKDTIKQLPQKIKKRIKGQDEAVYRVSEIIQRACLGLTDIRSGSPSRPKGILFLAGPTGTGKTELAKSVAEVIFGDESFITRFDMSEYMHPHSDQKLMGAPPGYVGYDSGGQLTNAVKEKPFNILLFDEIEKAHPSILDKFLQILDDGRMTDSFGETVYFTESLIIFTSNLGMTLKLSDGSSLQNVTPDMDHNTVKAKIESAIKDYFINIGRPELLNRIGSNIIVFDFIKDDPILIEIVEMQLNKIKKNLLEKKGFNLVCSDLYKQKLLECVKLNTENGARGVGNKIDELLLDLLPAVLIENNPVSGDTIIVEDIIGRSLVVKIQNGNKPPYCV